ncbi:hypothetical protein MnTg04_00365 [bacterium MnTg04]|nr:hypothetical protein MnTg04_00365 [bacterium MnTg04]
MMTKSIRRPVWGVIDRLRSTSASRFSPSGVSSNAHARIKAKGKPINSSISTIEPAHSGIFSSGNATSIIWIASQPTIR